jgi:hypothetical protein
LSRLPRMLHAMRWSCLLGMLSAGAQASDWLTGEAMEALLRWDIAAVLPDARGQAQDSAPRIVQLRGLHLAVEGGSEQLLVCATLIFDEPETEATGVAVIYALAEETGARPFGSPYFYGMNWMRGQVPLADACDAAASGMGWNAAAQRLDP